MLGAVADFAAATGRRVGVKVAGGVRTAKDAVRYLVLVKENRRARMAHPGRCSGSAPRACSTTSLMQRRKQLTGVYPTPDYFTLD